MRDAMLIVHFVGLAMGLGTSFAFMFLGKSAAGIQDQNESMTFMSRISVISRMGQIGLLLLVLTGGYLMTSTGNRWKTLGEDPLLLTKLILVVVLGGLIGMTSSKMKKAIANRSMEQMNKIRPLGMLNMLVALAIVVLAVLKFH